MEFFMSMGDGRITTALKSKTKPALLLRGLVSSRQVKFLLLFFLGFSPAGAAAGSEDEREEMIDKFLEYRQKNSALYQSPPITHLVPNFNTITYAANVNVDNLKLLPSDDNGIVNETNAGQRDVALKGYTISPHLAMSLKNVGLGFSVEKSQRTARYHWDPSGSSYHSLQQSVVEASGLGFNLSVLPFPKAFKKVKIAAIIGGKSLNVRHRFTRYLGGNQPVTIQESDYTKLRYTIQRYEAGLNINIPLLKSFRLIPWSDYSYTDIKDANESYKSYFRSDSMSAFYENDVRLFWLDNPKFRYGIDIGLYLGDFAVRVGGLLGTLANLNAVPDYVQDQSVALSVSWDQKGS
jgi:hypothetical protein